MVLLILWLLGLVSSYTMGGFVHVVFGGFAIMAVLVKVIQGRRILQAAGSHELNQTEGDKEGVK